ncbi:FHA domain-containing protein, partial [Patescibacteria group bacterium]
MLPKKDINMSLLKRGSSDRFSSGLVEPVSLFITLFLILTIAVGVSVISKEGVNFDFRELAMWGGSGSTTTTKTNNQVNRETASRNTKPAAQPAGTIGVSRDVSVINNSADSSGDTGQSNATVNTGGSSAGGSSAGAISTGVPILPTSLQPNATTQTNQPAANTFGWSPPPEEVNNLSYYNPANNNGCNFISGTYCTATGDRYVINIPSTQKAYGDWVQEKTNELLNISNDEIIQSAKNDFSISVVACGNRPDTTACYLEEYQKKWITDNIILDKGTKETVIKNVLNNKLISDYTDPSISDEKLAQLYGDPSIAKNRDLLIERIPDKYQRAEAEILKDKNIKLQDYTYLSDEDFNLKYPGKTRQSIIAGLNLAQDKIKQLDQTRTKYIQDITKFDKYVTSSDNELKKEYCQNQDNDRTCLNDFKNVDYLTGVDESIKKQAIEIRSFYNDLQIYKNEISKIYNAKSVEEATYIDSEAIKYWGSKDMENRMKNLGISETRSEINKVVIEFQKQKAKLDADYKAYFTYLEKLYSIPPSAGLPAQLTGPIKDNPVLSGFANKILEQANKLGIFLTQEQLQKQAEKALSDFRLQQQKQGLYDNYINLSNKLAACTSIGCATEISRQISEVEKNNIFDKIWEKDSQKAIDFQNNRLKAYDQYITLHKDFAGCTNDSCIRVVQQKIADVAKSEHLNEELIKQADEQIANEYEYQNDKSKVRELYMQLHKQFTDCDGNSFCEGYLAATISQIQNSTYYDNVWENQTQIKVPTTTAPPPTTYYGYPVLSADEFIIARQNQEQLFTSLANFFPTLKQNIVNTNTKYCQDKLNQDGSSNLNGQVCLTLYSQGLVKENTPYGNLTPQVVNNAKLEAIVDIYGEKASDYINKDSWVPDYSKMSMEEVRIVSTHTEDILRKHISNSPTLFDDKVSAESYAVSPKLIELYYSSKNQAYSIKDIVKAPYAFNEIYDNNQWLNVEDLGGRELARQNPFIAATGTFYDMITGQQLGTSAFKNVRFWERAFLIFSPESKTQERDYITGISRDNLATDLARLGVNIDPINFNPSEVLEVPKNNIIFNAVVSGHNKNREIASQYNRDGFRVRAGSSVDLIAIPGAYITGFASGFLYPVGGQIASDLIWNTLTIGGKYFLEYGISKEDLIADNLPYSDLAESFRDSRREVAVKSFGLQTIISIAGNYAGEAVGKRVQVGKFADEITPETEIALASSIKNQKLFYKGNSTSLTDDFFKGAEVKYLTFEDPINPGKFKYVKVPSTIESKVDFTNFINEQRLIAANTTVVKITNEIAENAAKAISEVTPAYKRLNLFDRYKFEEGKFVGDVAKKLGLDNSFFIYPVTARALVVPTQKMTLSSTWDAIRSGLKQEDVTTKQVAENIVQPSKVSVENEQIAIKTADELKDTKPGEIVFLKEATQKQPILGIVDNNNEFKAFSSPTSRVLSSPLVPSRIKNAIIESTEIVDGSLRIKRANFLSSVFKQEDNFDFLKKAYNPDAAGYRLVKADVDSSGKVVLVSTSENPSVKLMRAVNEFNENDEVIEDIIIKNLQKRGKFPIPSNPEELAHFSSDQAELIIDSIFNDPDTKGKVFLSFTGSGKSTVIFPVISIQKALKGKNVLIILRTESDVNNFLSDFPINDIESAFGLKVEKFLSQSGDAFPEGAKIVVTTKNVIFETLKEGNQAKVMLDYIDGQVLIADEVHDTLNLLEKYAVSSGEIIPIAETKYASTARYFAEVTQLNSMKKLLGRVKENINSGGRISTIFDFQGDKATLKDKKLLGEIYSDMLDDLNFQRNSVGSELSSIKTRLKNATNPETFEKILKDVDEIVVKLDRPGVALDEQTLTFLNRSKAFNANLKPLSQIPGNNYGEIALRAGDIDIYKVAPKEFNTLTGQQYSRAYDAMAYEFYGREMLSAVGIKTESNLFANALTVDQVTEALGNVRISLTSTSTNYASFGSRFGEIIGGSGTPTSTAEQLKDVFGILLSSNNGQVKTVGEIFDEVRNKLNSRQLANNSGRAIDNDVRIIKNAEGIENIVKEAQDNAVSTRRNYAVALGESPNEKIIQKIIGSENEYGVILKADGNHYAVNARGNIVERFKSLDEANNYLTNNKSAYRIYELGATTGIDSPMRSSEAFIVFTDDLTDFELLAQALGRDRGNEAGKAALDTAFAKTQVVLMSERETPLTFDEAIKDIYQKNSEETIKIKRLKTIDVAIDNQILKDLESMSKKFGIGSKGLSSIKDQWFEESANDARLFVDELSVEEYLSKKVERGRGFLESAFKDVNPSRWKELGMDKPLAVAFGVKSEFADVPLSRAEDLKQLTEIISAKFKPEEIANIFPEVVYDSKPANVVTVVPETTQTLKGIAQVPTVVSNVTQKASTGITNATKSMISVPLNAVKNTGKVFSQVVSNLVPPRTEDVITNDINTLALKPGFDIQTGKFNVSQFFNDVFGTTLRTNVNILKSDINQGKVTDENNLQERVNKISSTLPENLKTAFREGVNEIFKAKQEAAIPPFITPPQEQTPVIPEAIKEEPSVAQKEANLPSVEQAQITTVEVIGRLEENGGLSGSLVSRNHALVYRNNASGVLSVADYNSTNGTYIRKKGQTTDQRISGTVELNADDEVVLGGRKGNGRVLTIKTINGKKELLSEKEIILGKEIQTPDVPLLDTDNVSQIIGQSKVEPLVSDLPSLLKPKITIHGGEYMGRILTTDDLYKAKLYPKYTISVQGVQYYVSDPFKLGDSGRIAYILYVDDGKGNLIARSFYRSNSAVTWRYLPGYTANEEGRVIWYSKGYGEEGINAPLQIQQLLSTLLDEKVPLALTNPDYFFAGTAYGRRMSDSLIPDPVERITLDYDRSGDLPNPKTIKFTNAEDAPDFNSYISSWEENTKIYGLISKDVFLSKNKKYIYVFYRDQLGRAGISFVENNSEPMSQGVRRRAVVLGPLATPIFEYEDQSYQYGNSELRNGSYVDMYKNFLSKIPVIQEYQNFITGNSVKVSTPQKQQVQQPVTIPQIQQIIPS